MITVHYRVRGLNRDSAHTFDPADTDQAVACKQP